MGLVAIVLDCAYIEEFHHPRKFYQTVLLQTLCSSQTLLSCVGATMEMITSPSRSFPLGPLSATPFVKERKPNARHGYKYGV